MSIKNKTNLTGSLTEPSRGKNNFLRAVLVSACLVVLVTGISLVFIRKSSHQPVAGQNLGKEATASPAVSSAGSTSAAAPAAPRPFEAPQAKPNGPTTNMRGNAAQKSVAGIKARDKFLGSRIRELARTAKLKQLERKGLAQRARVERQSPASTLAASQGVFRTSPQPLLTEKRNPVFSIVRRPQLAMEQSSLTSKSADSALRPSDVPAEVGQEPSQRSSGEPVSEDIAATPIEPPVEGANLPQAKPPSERRMLTASKGTGGAAAATGKSATEGQPNLQAQLQATGLEKGIEARSYDIVGVRPSEYNGDVRDLPAVPSIPKIQIEVEKEMNPEKVAAGAAAPVTNVPNNIPLAPMPSPIQNFAGLSFNSVVTGGTAGAGWPPDVNGDVGLNHYIIAVNDAFGIYNKTGTLLAAFTENSLWAGQGIGTPCNTNNFGDPVVVYDQFADRWILTNFAFATVGGNPVAPYYQCFAISKTSDPVAGGWWFYAVQMDSGAAGQPPATTLNDYPKFGNWNDGCLYMAANEFGGNGTAFSGVAFASFNKSDMESGAVLRGAIGFIATQNIFTMIPSNISGAKASATSLPPAGTPNYFVSESTSVFALEVRKFTPGANCAAGGALGAATIITQAAYGLSLGNVVPQPPPATAAHNLDTLDDRLMQKVQYRRVGAAESLWVTQTTRTSPNTARPQWSQINVNGGVVSTTLVQTQIYAPDTTLYRWMASIAADHNGNAAMGYSTSNVSSPNFPSIAYSGRLVGDALNNLPQTEVQLIAGTGPQTTTAGLTPIHRWGDYTSMSVDPVDDCTFWYAGMYFTNVGADATRNWNTRIGSFKFPSCSAPTEAKVKTFTADGLDDGRVLLRWSSGYEVDNLGYNVYREVNGQRTKINPQTIAGSALVTGPKVALTAGKSYAWGDQLTDAGTRYLLEAIDLSGKSTWTGPISLNAQGAKAQGIEQSVLLARIGMASAQMTLGQGSAPVERKAEIASVSPEAMQLQTDLAGKPAVKLSVAREGWYRVSQRDLVNAGLSSKVDPRNLQLYVDGRPVPMIVNGEQDGRFDTSDSVEFFGVGINSAVTNSHVYWLAAGSQTGTRIKSSRGVSQTPAAKSFQSSVERRDRTLYFSALKNGEAENFFGPVIGSAPVDQSLSLTNLSPTPLGSATLEVAVQGVTTTDHQVKVMLNGAALGTISFSGQARGVQSFAVEQSSLREGVNSLQLVSLGGSADISLADSARVIYWHNYQADSNQLQLSAQGGQQVTLSGFTSSDARVMDVTDANNPQELPAAGSVGKNAPGTLTVNVPGAGQRTLYAFAGDQAKTAALKLNTPSNWRQAGRGADFVIFTRQELMASLAPLVSLRQKDGLSTAAVDVEDVYDEFSFGNKSPQAIKDFLQFAKSNWSLKPRFVLLAGDASYDSKNYLGYGDADLVPTKLIDTQYMETASDDWFSDFNDSGSPQMAMGRLPVGNASQASALVAKIMGYESSRVANSIVLASDSTDGFDFAAANDLLRPFIPAGIQVTDVRRGSSDDATVKAQLLKSINGGAKVVSYNGHGSTNQWRGNILTGDDARSLTNAQSLSLFVMMTCLNGYFDDPVLDSLSESLLRASNGGAVAVWASTGQSDPSVQATMNQEFFRQLFGATPLRVGEAAMKAKSAVTDADVRRTWVLFGDPTMRLK